MTPRADPALTHDGDVLTALAGAEDRFTLSRLESLIPHRSREGLRQALRRLVDEGIVDRQVAGTTHTYSLNRQHLAAPSIIELASLQTRFVERLRETLQGWSPQPIFAAVFGSSARGTMTPTSDIDLILIHPDSDTSAWEADVDALALSAQRWTGRPMNILVMAREEVRDARHEEPVLQDIARDGLPVLGTMSSFVRLIGGRR